jgi:hypothetical protein
MVMVLVALNGAGLSINPDFTYSPLAAAENHYFSRYSPPVGQFPASTPQWAFHGEEATQRWGL